LNIIIITVAEGFVKEKSQMCYSLQRPLQPVVFGPKKYPPPDDVARLF